MFDKHFVMFRDFFFFVPIYVENFVKIFIHNYIKDAEWIYNFYANRMIDGLDHRRIKINLINS